MAQKSNMVSYRGGVPSLLLICLKKKLFHFFLFLVKHFYQVLALRQVLLPKINLSVLQSICKCRGYIFFKTFKLRFFLKKCSVFEKKLFSKQFLLQKCFSIKKSFSFLIFQKCASYIYGLNFFYCQLKNVHIFLTTITGQFLLYNFFYFFKKFGHRLFPRRFNFYIDMVKLSVLFFLNKISSEFYLKLLGEIFKILQKNLHARFFVFLKSLFKLLLVIPKKVKVLRQQQIFILVRGIKFRANGRLRGKPRSNSCVFSIGQHPIQTITSAISFAKTHVYTRYGVFGFRLWTYRLGCFIS